MRVSPQLSIPKSRGGFALVATLAVLTLLSAVSLAVFGSTMASFKVGVTDMEKSRTYYAAEGAADYAMSQIAAALADGVVEDAELYGISDPSIEGFSIDSFTVVKNGFPTVERITDGTFAGLAAVTQLIDITAEARSPDETSSEILVTAKAQSIPIFQFGVFFEKDLEIHPGGNMYFDGWIHSNGNLYLNSINLYFRDLLTTPNDVVWDRKDKHEVYNGVRIADAGGTDVMLDFDSRITPDANAFRAKSDAAFDNRLMTSAYDVDSLKVPLPDGVDPIEVIMPRDDADSEVTRAAKMAWKADWYIEVDMSVIAGTGSGGEPTGEFGVVINHLEALIAIYSGTIEAKLLDALTKVNDALAKINTGDASGALADLDAAKSEVRAAKKEGLPRLTQNQVLDEIDAVKADISAGGDGQDLPAGNNLCEVGMTHTRPTGLAVPTQAECDLIFNLREDDWFESREWHWVDQLEINVGALFDWAAARGTTVEVLYVTLQSDQGFRDPKGDGVFPIVRLVNGAELDAPITFASNHPMYVQGDYNNVGWFPSAVMGDAMSFLSNSWDDSQHQVVALTDTAIAKAAIDTEYYVAVLAGHSPTSWDHEDMGTRGQYGGGLENYLRWLEKWRRPTGGATTCRFRGSLVSLAYAQQAVSDWVGGHRVYVAPTRDFEFDMRLDLIENMPPGTPHVGNVVHTAFRPVFN